MNVVARSKLQEALKEWDGRHEELFTKLAMNGTRAREAFNRMYRLRAFAMWSTVEKENTLGYMLGYNVISG